MGPFWLSRSKALLSETSSVPGGLRVRMALHTGVVEARDVDYFVPR